ncbi:hypothetical protein A5N15_00420 [Rothia kristinae]|uniref:Uncharacterized protein n=1 Tax=Rothia kristinae TaxID=37923 RepID=A0A657IWC7_9MICC|nr:hypothetical protein A5N15_00420 [Rothia kristinae]
MQPGQVVPAVGDAQVRDGTDRQEGLRPVEAHPEGSDLPAHPGQLRGDPLRQGTRGSVSVIRTVMCGGAEEVSPWAARQDSTRSWMCSGTPSTTLR